MSGTNGVAWLYSLPGCHACEDAASLLRAGGVEFRQEEISNPILELGIRSLFKDRKVHAPVLYRPHDGVYILGESEPRQFLKIHEVT